MLKVLAALIFIRPFLSSLAYPYADIMFSGVLIAVSIIWIGLFPPKSGNFRDFRLPLTLLACAVVFSFIFSRDKLTSMVELYKYIPHALILFICSSFDEKKSGVLIKVLIASGACVCVIALYQFFFGFAHLSAFMEKNALFSPVAQAYIESKRVFAPFVTPNILGGYIAMLIPLTFISRKTCLLALPFTAVLLLTKSFGSLLALFFAVYISFILFVKFKPDRLAILTLILSVIGLLFIFRLIGITGMPDTIGSGYSRVEYWMDTLKVIRSAPMFGIGPGNLNIAGSIYSHNAYLQIFAETGILGISAFLWFIFGALKRFLRDHSARAESALAPKPYIICAILVFLFHNLVDFSFYLPEVSFLWWALLGLIIGSRRETA